MAIIEVKIARMSDYAPSPLLSYATPGSAGLDLAAAIPRTVIIPPGGRLDVGTGIAVQLPGAEYVGLVFPRSGLAAKDGITLANAVGVIDSDYRGEIIIPLKNDGRDAFELKRGRRIAQIVFLPVARVHFVTVEELEPTARGRGGFGSTGMD